jgi:hypothetical protein
MGVRRWWVCLALALVNAGCAAENFTATFRKYDTPILLGPVTRIGAPPEICRDSLRIANEGSAKQVFWALPLPYIGGTGGGSWEDPMPAPTADSTANICLSRVTAGTQLLHLGIFTWSQNYVRVESQRGKQ